MPPLWNWDWPAQPLRPAQQVFGLALMAAVRPCVAGTLERLAGVSGNCAMRKSAWRPDRGGALPSAPSVGGGSVRRTEDLTVIRGADCRGRVRDRPAHPGADRLQHRRISSYAIGGWSPAARPATTTCRIVEAPPPPPPPIVVANLPAAPTAMGGAHSAAATRGSGSLGIRQWTDGAMISIRPLCRARPGGRWERPLGTHGGPGFGCMLM